MRWNKPLIIGAAVLALGSGPLLLYCVFGPADGNPIGLGLLFFFTAPFGLGFTARGLAILNRDIGAGRRSVPPPRRDRGDWP